MPIRMINRWQVDCDHCPKSLQIVAGKTWSPSIRMTILTRGELHAHLRHERWTIGNQILCPDCAVRP